MSCLRLEALFFRRFEVLVRAVAQAKLVLGSFAATEINSLIFFWCVTTRRKLGGCVTPVAKGLHGFQYVCQPRTFSDNARRYLILAQSTGTPRVLHTFAHICSEERAGFFSRSAVPQCGAQAASRGQNGTRSELQAAGQSRK